MALEDAKGLPCGRDLPSSDGVPMESERHVQQSRLYLIQPLQRHFEETGFVGWVGGNSFVYFSRDGCKAQCVGPDMYVVNGGVRRGQEKWVSWEEGGLLPTLIVELSSPSTAALDRGRKFRIYRDVLRCPDYFLYNTTTTRLDGFMLAGGEYLPILPDADGALACSSLPGLRVGVRDRWLRFIDARGKVLPTAEELAERERQQADEERQRAERERQRADDAQARVQELEQRMHAMEERLRRLEG